MSSAGAQCDHIIHVSTQLPYVCVVAGISFIGFLLAGIICNWFIVFPIQVAIMLAVLLFIKHKFKNS
jgi:Na+/H+ antiporter NhaC